jgi:RNA polymerase sigma factor (sigma-70 family)
LAATQTGGPATDADLLERFVRHQDEVAFARLLERHGAMVWGVCRRILLDAHRAEDAFQATFLILLRKAGAIKRQERLASWLYGVAVRVALEARGQATRRQERERMVPEFATVEAPKEAVDRDLCAILDEEVQRLPARYREPVVLCYFQAKTNAEAAALLGWPEGTVFGRLARARECLRKRLQRRGVTLSAGTLTVALAQQMATAAVPDGVRQATVNMALLAAMVGAATTGAASPPVAALADGVLKSMFIRKLQTSVVLVTTTLLLASSALFVHRSKAEPPLIPAQVSEAPKTTVAGFAETDFKQLKPVLDLKNQPWTTIPWKYSLTEARKLAAQTKKPIFMVVNTGNVMGCV